MRRRRLVVGLLVGGAAIGVGLGDVAAKGHASPSIRMINFKVTDDRGKVHTVSKGGTLFLSVPYVRAPCPLQKPPAKFNARYVASGMSTKAIVTVTWTRDQRQVFKKTQRWGTPANGLWGYHLKPPGLDSGKWVIRFVSRGKLLGKGSFELVCGRGESRLPP